MDHLFHLLADRDKRCTVEREVITLAKNFNYRRFYKEYYGIDFDSEYEIHHIDFDKENNDINNLLLLPRKLHRQYHFVLNACGAVNGKVNMDFQVYGESHGYNYKMMENLCEIMKEIDQWVLKKEHMDYAKYVQNILKSGKTSCLG